MIFSLTSFYFIFDFQYVVKAISEVEVAENIALEEEKIIWNAYFKRDDKKVREIETTISTEEILYLDIQVKEHGVLSDESIDFKDANFKVIADKINNPYVQKVDKDTGKILLQTLSAGNNITIEIPIEFKKQEIFAKDYFEQSSTITLVGNYSEINIDESNKKGKVRTIQSQANLMIHWKGNINLIANQDKFNWGKFKNGDSRRNIWNGK